MGVTTTPTIMDLATTAIHLLDMQVTLLLVVPLVNPTVKSKLTMSSVSSAKKFFFTGGDVWIGSVRVGFDWRIELFWYGESLKGRLCCDDIFVFCSLMYINLYLHLLIPLRKSFHIYVVVVMLIIFYFDEHQVHSMLSRSTVTSFFVAMVGNLKTLRAFQVSSRNIFSNNKASSSFRANPILLFCFMYKA